MLTVGVRRGNQRYNNKGAQNQRHGVTGRVTISSGYRLGRGQRNRGNVVWVKRVVVFQSGINQ